MSTSIAYACAFDIDGTLVRWSQPIGLQLIIQAFKRTFPDSTLTKSDIQPAGKTDLQLFHELLSAADIPKTAARHYQYCFFEHLSALVEEHVQRSLLQLLPGIPNLLQALRNEPHITLGLITGNIQPVARIKLSAQHLWHFFSLGSFGENAIDRAMLVDHFARQLTQRYHRAIPFVVIGDTPNDIIAAHRHGIPVIAVATGPMSMSQLQQYSPDVVLSSLENVEQVLYHIAELCAKN